MPHLRSLLFKTKAADGFPFDVPAIRALDGLEFRAPVTLFVGENGSGKSTLLEAVACAAALVTAGSDAAARDETLREVRELAKTLRLSWEARTHRGFFLRAEDFFGYAKHIATLKLELEGEVEKLRREPGAVARLAQPPFPSSTIGASTTSAVHLTILGAGK